MEIRQILDKIDDYQLFVPAFQREYVWKRKHAKELIDSLIKEYPTGTMLTWETSSPPELKGKHVYDKKQGTVKLILDGQQRITTLYMLIKGTVPPYYTEHEILNDPRDLYVNVESLELEYYMRTKMEKSPLWVHITEIFKRNIRSRDVIHQLEELGENVDRERQDSIDDNFRAIETIPNRMFLEQEIPVRANLKEAIDIFYIVNASGVNLTDAELALAQISGYWPQVRESFKHKLVELEKEGFVFSLDFLVYAMMGILHQGGSELQKLHSPENKDKMKTAWDLLRSRTLDYVINILRGQMFIDHTKEINSVYALIPIIVYTYNKGKENLSQEEINKIKKWFYYSQIRQRYVSQMPQKLDKDVGIVMRSKTPFDELLSIIALDRPLDIKKDEFVGVDIRHALYGLMRWYFKSRNAICFSTGVSIRRNMGKNYGLEWDHIFPFSILKEYGYNQNNRHKYSLAQEITNRAVLTQAANRNKSNRLAQQYLSEVKTKFPSALKLQCIPEDEELWKLENFEKFLDVRRSMLANELNSFLNSITETEETVVETSIEEIIAEGESAELEIKSSFCWDMRLGKRNKDLEQVIMKAISGFSNGEGGTILIGVGDNGEVLGLEYDYTALGGNRDEFELHFRNLANSYFDKSFVSHNVDISFPKSGTYEICKIDIKRAKSPIYIMTSDKNGFKSEKFYVRQGNSTQELSVSEANKYIAERFNGA